MTTSPQRREQLAAFFAAHLHHLRRTVAGHARSNDQVIDDACATARTALVGRADITLYTRGFNWLATVAIHAAWQLHTGHRDEIPVGVFPRRLARSRRRGRARAGRPARG